MSHRCLPPSCCAVAASHSGGPIVTLLAVRLPAAKHDTAANCVLYHSWQLLSNTGNLVVHIFGHLGASGQAERAWRGEHCDHHGRALCPRLRIRGGYAVETLRRGWHATSEPPLAYTATYACRARRPAISRVEVHTAGARPRPSSAACSTSRWLLSRCRGDNRPADPRVTCTPFVPHRNLRLLLGPMTRCCRPMAQFGGCHRSADWSAPPEATSPSSQTTPKMHELTSSPPCASH